MRSRIILLIGLCVALAGAQVKASPLADVPRERRSYHMTGENQDGTQYSWFPTYDIEFASQELHIYTSIYLYGINGVTQQQIDNLEPTWESGIEGRWNDSYGILHDSQYYYDIIYDMSFVDTWQVGVDHYQVQVRPGPERSSMTRWDTLDTGQVAAHEYGHMVGNYDEYGMGAQDPYNPIIDTTSIMGSTSPAAVAYARHYEPVVAWLEDKYSLDLDALEVVQAVSIDIRPGSDLNCLNLNCTNHLNCKGLLPVAILGDEDFDVGEINISSLELAGAAPITKGNSGKMGSFACINDDEWTDLMLHFAMSDLVDIGSDTAGLSLTGSLNGGTLFGGSDSIRIVPPGDVNGDGFVGGADLSIIISNWGLDNAVYEQGDLSGDGVVEGADYSEVISYWGQASMDQGPGTPEPATLGLLLLGGLALLRHRR